MKLTNAVLEAFEADVEAAMETFQMPGAAIALVEDGDIVYVRGFGVRDAASNEPVTPGTRFRVASNTKSMTALLAATFVDDGVLSWDEPVAAAWPDFVAPTPELTRRIRLRDLLGMGSGIAESPTIEFFMSAGTESALDQVRSVAHLPVIGAPGAAYYYNNTLVSAAGYLAPLAAGTPPDRLEATYASLVQARVFDAIGMADAVIADDPRPFGDDHAVGYTRDMFAELSPVPFVSIAGAAPAGAAIASATDIARYLMVQLDRGLASGGTRVVSEKSLAETHRPAVAVPPDAANALPAALLGDTAAMHYCMGWFLQTFRDGRQLLWHGGAIDGFGSQMGFFPAERLGFVVLTNLEPTYGASFNVAVQSLLLRRLYGVNCDLPELMNAAAETMVERTAALAKRAQPVDPASVGRYLGLYSDGFLVRLDSARMLRVDHDIRSMTVLELSDGGLVIADGPGVVAQKRLTFADGNGTPTMTIDGFAPVRWLTAG